MTGANERAVKNWFKGINGPSGSNLVDLARHSDCVLETFLKMAGRPQMVGNMLLDDVRARMEAALATIVAVQATQRARTG